MFDFDRHRNAEDLIGELDRFVQFWVQPALQTGQRSASSGSSIPPSLNTLLSIHATYSHQIFSGQNRLLRSDEISITDNRVHFIDINQSGPIVYTLADRTGDPPVYVIENGEHLKCADSLSEYLVSFSLAELMYWAATQENDCGECWDLDFPEIGRRNGHSVNTIWTRRPYLWPGNLATFNLIDDNVIAMETSNGALLSSSVNLSPKLRQSVLREFPAWD